MRLALLIAFVMYLPRLKFSSSSKIVVIDDQESALELWKMKFDEAQILNKVKFSMRGKISEIDNATQDLSSSDLTYLVDHELSSKTSGFDILMIAPSGSMRCLVTVNFDHTSFRESCASSGIYIIPNSTISSLPIVILE